MNIYRHINNGKLYIIEHLIRDIKHLNANAFAGIYAIPYLNDGDEIVFRSQNEPECLKFVEENFNIVSSR